MLLFSVTQSIDTPILLKVARPAGFELATPGFGDQCSGRTELGAYNDIMCYVTRLAGSFVPTSSFSSTYFRFASVKSCLSVWRLSRFSGSTAFAYFSSGISTFAVRSSLESAQPNAGPGVIAIACLRLRTFLLACSRLFIPFSFLYLRIRSSNILVLLIGRAAGEI